MPIEAGRVVARSYMAFALGLLGLNCLRGGMAGGGVPKNFDGSWDQVVRVHQWLLE